MQVESCTQHKRSHRACGVCRPSSRLRSLFLFNGAFALTTSALCPPALSPWFYGRPELQRGHTTRSSAARDAETPQTAPQPSSSAKQDVDGGTGPDGESMQAKPRQRRASHRSSKDIRAPVSRAGDVTESSNRSSGTDLHCGLDCRAKRFSSVRTHSTPAVIATAQVSLRWVSDL